MKTPEILRRNVGKIVVGIGTAATVIALAGAESSAKTGQAGAGLFEKPVPVIAIDPGAETEFEPYRTAYYSQTGDFDGNGFRDVSLALDTDHPADLIERYLYNPANGSFNLTPFSQLGEGTNYTGLNHKASDIDGDGMDDLSYIEDTSVWSVPQVEPGTYFTTLFSNEDGTVTAKRERLPAPAWGNWATDGIGLTSVELAPDRGIVAFEGKKDRTFQYREYGAANPLFRSACAPYHSCPRVKFADTNGDGKKEIHILHDRTVYPSVSDFSVITPGDNPDSLWTRSDYYLPENNTPYPPLNPPHRAADLAFSPKDEAGKEDLYIYSQKADGSRVVVKYEDDGDGALQVAGEFPTKLQSSRGIRDVRIQGVFDVDGDGDLDFASLTKRDTTDTSYAGPIWASFQAGVEYCLQENGNFTNCSTEYFPGFYSSYYNDTGHFTDINKDRCVETVVNNYGGVGIAELARCRGRLKLNPVISPRLKFRLPFPFSQK